MYDDKINMLIMFHFETEITKGTKIEEIKNILINLCKNKDEDLLKESNISKYKIIEGTVSSISSLLMAGIKKYGIGSGTPDRHPDLDELERGYRIFKKISQICILAHEGDDNKRSFIDLIYKEKING